MDAEHTMEKKAEAVDTVDAGSHVDYGSGEAGPVIYIDPAREAACRKKFDKYVVPVSVIFLVLSTLDRNNVGNPFPPFRATPITHSITNSPPAWKCPCLWL